MLCYIIHVQWTPFSELNSLATLKFIHSLIEAQLLYRHMINIQMLQINALKAAWHISISKWQPEKTLDSLDSKPPHSHTGVFIYFSLSPLRTVQTVLDWHVYHSSLGFIAPVRAGWLTTLSTKVHQTWFCLVKFSGMTKSWQDRK